MFVATKGIYIVAAKRTAFGTLGGALKDINQTQLQTIAAKAAIDASGLNPNAIDTVVFGHIISSGSVDGIYMPRHVSLQCGVPIEKPALAVNRLCGSGFQSIISGAQDILSGNAKIALTGGVENMSQAPFIARNIRFGTTLGKDYQLEDSLWRAFTDTYCQLPMALTAEKLAEQYKITRKRVDEFSLRSQKCWERAQNEGVFNEEIVPIKIKVKGKEIDFLIDEHPRPQSTLEGLAKLQPLFKKNGVVTAGTASGICDGAAAVVLANEAAIEEYNLKPLSRLVAYSIVGCPPDIMGIGPVPAISNILNTSGKRLEDIDLIEINEAFAAQTLACVDALKLDMNKLNVNGGAIALGHPLGASGSRIVCHLTHEMKRKNLKYSIGAACIGGGQGIAVMLQSC